VLGVTADLFGQYEQKGPAYGKNKSDQRLLWGRLFAGVSARKWAIAEPPLLGVSGRSALRLKRTLLMFIRNRIEAP
jgi:hypothetical protein